MLLFLLYTVYADDLNIFHKINSLFEYCSSYKLSLNLNKCFYILFIRNFNKIIFNYNIQDVKLNRVDHTKDLGVIFVAK